MQNNMSSLTPLSSFYLSYVFIYLRPSQVEEALLLLSKYRVECKIICGGQSFLILMRQGLVVSEYLMDIKFLKELNYIDYDPQRGLEDRCGDFSSCD